METQDSNSTEQENKKNFFDDLEEKHAEHIARHHSGPGRFLGGLIILGVGVVLLLKQLGTVIFPDWLFTWPVFLIVLGIYIGARHSFRTMGWIIWVLIGGVFLTEDFYPSLTLSEYIWPIVIIAVGLMMILRPKRRWDWRNQAYWEGKGRKHAWKHQWKEQWKQQYKYGQTAATGSYSEDDYIDSVSVFGGIHKVVVSKNFQGGDVVNIFGGTEINLTQADFKGTIVLDVVQIFGGTKIIIPSDWTVKSKVVSIFGSVDDKRNPSITQHNPDKVLILEGTCIFAGIDIISY